MAKLISYRLVSVRWISLGLLAVILIGCGEKIDPNDPSLKSNIKTKPGMVGGAPGGGAGSGKAD